MILFSQNVPTSTPSENTLYQHIMPLIIVNYTLWNAVNAVSLLYSYQVACRNIYSVYFQPVNYSAITTFPCLGGKNVEVYMSSLVVEIKLDNEIILIWKLLNHLIVKIDQ